MNRRAVKKRRAYRWGQGAEWLAILALILKGYRIRARRFTCKAGEIELVAQKGQVLCFVEVKARRSQAEALEALTTHQQKRIMRAAEWYIAREGHRREKDIAEISYRFDLMAVEPWRWPTHVKDAWQARGERFRQ